MRIVGSELPPSLEASADRCSRPVLRRPCEGGFRGKNRLQAGSYIAHRKIDGLTGKIAPILHNHGFVVTDGGEAACPQDAWAYWDNVRHHRHIIPQDSLGPDSLRADFLSHRASELHQRIFRQRRTYSMASEARVGNLETMPRTTGWLKIAGLLALSVCGWPVPANAAQDAFAPPRSRYEWDVASGVLWRVGGGATPLWYTCLLY